jgi:ABC-2 type transport system permease protein
MTNVECRICPVHSSFVILLPARPRFVEPVSVSRRLPFSFERLMGIIAKEFTQMRRDRLTFAMMLGIPIIQLLLFGFAINSDPRHLPAAVLLADRGPHGRTMLQAMKNSTYFDFTREVRSEREGRDLLARGEVQFVINIPVNFSRDLLRGDRPILLVEADATDPAATGLAIGSLGPLSNALRADFKGPLEFLNQTPSPFEPRVHALYNPESNTQYNIVPGLMGVILTMTMIMITGLAITRERERGTMENLLSMPTRPSEVLVGKIVPYILVGYVQVAVILIASRLIFHVPMHGSIPLLLVCALVFIAANLAMGITFSTVAKNQLQAMQMTFFVFLPSILLSGFMFPFRGMPHWAQGIGEVFPLTHFLRIVRGILLKGNGLADVTRELWPIALFAAIMLTVGVKRYRQTLD